MKMYNSKRFIVYCTTLIFCITLFIGPVSENIYASGLVISEFMASNSETLADEDGDYPDWIELYNPTAEEINVLYWSLTDNATSPDKWRFPDIIILPDSYLIVYASGKDRTGIPGNLHTSFKLSASGEYLGLYEPDGTIASSFGDTYPEQYEDVSYGDFEGNLMYFSSPTPGAANAGSEYLPPPEFSVSRGFYTSPFDVELSTSVAGAKIYYTTNGNLPTETGGSEYITTVTISTTTPLRAIVTKAGSNPSHCITNTYFFLEDVIDQPNNPEGYPSEWGQYVAFNGTAQADYEMDPDITTHPDYEDLMIPSLLDLPAISLVTDIGFLFSHEIDSVTGGIYIYTGAPGDETGLGWERPVSCEYMFPESVEEGFQVNCGIRIQGGHSRRPEKSPKHSLRLLFKSMYGPGRLDYPVFGEDAAEEYNTLVLRSAYGNTWRHFDPNQRKRAQHIRDPWAKDTQLDMTHFSAHNKFAHLYINGIYWGVYNISERVDKAFMESYYGGNEDDFDILKDYGELVDGNPDAWNYLWNTVDGGSITDNTEYQKLLGNNPDGTPSASYESYLEATNLIDYMLLNFYGGNNDWDHHNWIAGRNRVNPGSGFQFYCWDTEKILEGEYENYVNENNGNRPSGIFQRLLANEEFRLLFADRVNLHLMNNGILTPQANIDRWMMRADEIELAMISESARWGDYRRDVHSWSGSPYLLYTVNDFWLVEQDRLRNEYFQNRTDIVLDQLKNAGMLPNIDPPVFSQHGGYIEENFALDISAPRGYIYYTMDGSDPRLVGGTIANSAILFSDPIDLGLGAIVKARAKDGTEWSALTMASFHTDEIPSAIPASQVLIEDLHIYPNPFTTGTTIGYTLPAGGNVEISVFSVVGKQVEKIDAGYQSKGQNFVTWEPENLEQGMYIVFISCGQYRANGKLLYMK